MNIYQAISPGYVETDFLLNASYTAEQSRSIFSSMKAIQPSEIADSVIYIMSAPQHVQVRKTILNTSLRELNFFSLKLNRFTIF